MGRRRNREVNVFGVSFLDVLSNTVGGLAFLLIIVFMLMSKRPEHAPPEILTQTLPDIYVGESYDLALSAKGGGGIYAWEMLEGTMPDGLELNKSLGLLSGEIKREKVLREPAVFEFTITCTGLGAKTDKRRFTMTLKPAKPFPATPVKISSQNTLPSAIDTVPYPLTLACTGGVPPYHWELTDGELPPGLHLGSDGLVSGQPKETGDFSFEISVRAGNKTADSVRLELAVLRKFEPQQPV